jgi:hypothetical protein
MSEIIQGLIALSLIWCVPVMFIALILIDRDTTK